MGKPHLSCIKCHTATLDDLTRQHSLTCIFPWRIQPLRQFELSYYTFLKLCGPARPARPFLLSLLTQAWGASSCHALGCRWTRPGVHRGPASEQRLGVPRRVEGSVTGRMWALGWLWKTAVEPTSLRFDLHVLRGRTRSNLDLKCTAEKISHFQRTNLE